MEANSGGVRPASAQDAAACLALYRPYVQNTAISWETDVPTVAEMAARIDGLRANHDWLALERGDRMIGFAYGQPLKPRWRRTRTLYAIAPATPRTRPPTSLRRHLPGTAEQGGAPGPTI